MKSSLVNSHINFLWKSNFYKTLLCSVFPENVAHMVLGTLVCALNWYGSSTRQKLPLLHLMTA